MEVAGVSIKVEAISYTDFYGGFSRMDCIGSFQFEEVDTGALKGSATRYYQDCDEIMLLA